MQVSNHNSILLRSSDMPATKWDGYRRFCPFARALDVVGERWTLVILHELLAGPRRYSELKDGLPGIGTNVLADRLRKLESAGVVARETGPVGDGVRYALTERGQALAPAMAELRRWGADELVSTAQEQRCFDLGYALPDELELHETYEWRIGERSVAFSIDGDRLCQGPGPADPVPSVVVHTTIEFLRSWAAGDRHWDDGLADGEVTYDGTPEAWDRMLLATNYPGRPAGLAERVIEAMRA